MVQASACGKVILFGEHAVVYGRPAVAAPVSQARAYAEVVAAPRCSGLRIVAADLGREFVITQELAGDPLALVALLTLRRLETPACDLTITVRSDLPIARGLGSGAAVSAAIVRALAAYVGQTLSPGLVAELAFEAERVYHGAPSGLDTTVIAYEQPIYFVKGQPAQPVRLGAPYTLVIADTGIPSPTREVVADVRRAWENDRSRYERLFDACARLAEAGRAGLEAGDAIGVGRLLNDNHAILQEMGVSSPELERLVRAARSAGALGAKLCGAGRGGNMLALAEPTGVTELSAALARAGAAGVIVSVLGEERR